MYAKNKNKQNKLQNTKPKKKKNRHTQTIRQHDNVVQKDNVHMRDQDLTNWYKNHHALFVVSQITQGTTQPLPTSDNVTHIMRREKIVPIHTRQSK